MSCHMVRLTCHRAPGKPKTSLLGPHRRFRTLGSPRGSKLTGKREQVQVWALLLKLQQLLQATNSPRCAVLHDMEASNPRLRPTASPLLSPPALASNQDPALRSLALPVRTGPPSDSYWTAAHQQRETHGRATGHCLTRTFSVYYPVQPR